MHNKKFSSIVAIFAVAIALFSAASFARAADGFSLVISEASPNFGGAANEFIELYNHGSTDVNLKETGLKLKLINSSGIPAPKDINWANTTIPAGGFFLFGAGTIDSTIFDATYGRTLMTGTGGAMITDKNDNVLDKLSWISLPTNKSMERLTGNTDTNNNSSFFLEDNPNPTNSTFVVEASDESDSGSDDTIQDESTKCTTSSQDVKLNEMFPYPETGDQEFVELKNFSAYCVDLSGWRIMDEKENKYIFASETIIEPGEFWHADRNFSMNNTTAETMYLLDSSGKEIDKASYDKAIKKYSFSLDGKEFRWTSTPTPGAENIFDASEDEKDDSSDGDISSETAGAANSENIYLNEILPNPKSGSDGEYIEIVNGGSEPVDLQGWRVKDASKSKGYQFKNPTAINAGEFLAIYRPDSKIALNNSDESVYLHDPQGNIVSSVSFDKSQKNSSYSFDGKNWKWSKYLTPGEKNKFDSEPSVKITKPKRAYKGLFTEFGAKAKDKETKKLKYAWDFGDGKKSYLAKTSHKYQGTGKYTVTLSVTDDSQTVEKSFTLQVKKYPKPNIEIVKIVPNPAGADAESEIIDVKNNSGKKIDLAGWKIATGSGEKIYNHPIIGEFSAGPNETKTITREFSKFSLNNKAGKVQLVMPDGKVADAVEYAKEKIADDEAYAKIDGEWQWIEPGAKYENSNSEDEAAVTDTATNEEENTGEILGAMDENTSFPPSYHSRFTSEDAYIFLSRINFARSVKKEMSYRPANNPSSNIAYLIASLI